MGEPRSFTEDRRVGELTPIDVDRLSAKDAPRVLYRAVIQNHACLEVHIKEQNKFNGQLTLDQIEATEKRQALADDVLDLKGLVINMQGEIQKIALGLGVTKAEPGDAKTKARVDIPWKTLGKIAGVMSGIILTIQVFGPPLVAFAVALLESVMKVKT